MAVNLKQKAHASKTKNKIAAKTFYLKIRDGKENAKDRKK
jgi:hypothetical protein